MIQRNFHDNSTAFGKASRTEKRISPRSPKQESAKIIVNRSHVTDCLVRNLSETGACLEVHSIVGIPEVFDLMINGESFMRICEFRWALEGCVGVKFLQG